MMCIIGFWVQLNYFKFKYLWTRRTIFNFIKKKLRTMLFFNSWLPHMITPNNDTNPTKFIHFLTSQRKRFI